MAKRSKSEMASGKCIKGHTYTPNNTGMSGDGRRYCRVCHAAAAKKRRAMEGSKPRAPWGSLSGRKKAPITVNYIAMAPKKAPPFIPRADQSHDDWLRYHGSKAAFKALKKS